MAEMPVYSGNRDVRFVAVRRGGELEDSQHRLLVLWAAACAGHVLGHYESQHPGDDRPRRAVEAARAWANGEITMRQARQAAYEAHEAARASEGAAREAARSAGHAAASAHMADHELGTAAYAIRAVRAATPPGWRDQAGREECCWQRDRLPEAIQELVLSDEERRNRKFWSLFNCEGKRNDYHQAADD